MCRCTPRSGQDFLNWGKAVTEWGVPEQGGFHLALRMKVENQSLGTQIQLRSCYIHPLVQTVLLQVAKHHPGSKEESPPSTHGVGGCAGLRRSGAGVGKGAEEGIKALK